MRNVFAFALALAVLPAAQAVAASDIPNLPGVTLPDGMAEPDSAPEPEVIPKSETEPAQEAPKAELTREERLDSLFSELKRERNEKAATRIARRIWQVWFQSGSASVDLMMSWANDAIGKKQYAVALDFLDQIVVLEPDFAEGWNRRATVHYMMRNFGKSMADIERTLQLEPRHFGALTGMAEIMKSRNRKRLALDAYQRVLAIYPMLRSAQDEVSTLSEDLAGEAI